MHDLLRLRLVPPSEPQGEGVERRRVPVVQRAEGAFVAPLDDRRRQRALVGAQGVPGPALLTGWVYWETRTRKLLHGVPS